MATAKSRQRFRGSRKKRPGLWIMTELSGLWRGPLWSPSPGQPPHGVEILAVKFRRFRRLADPGGVLERLCPKQRPETALADAPFAHVPVPVAPRAELDLGVVEVQGAHRAKADVLVDEHQK